MRLANTKRYYKDMAHYYFLQEKGLLMGYFHDLANDPQWSYSATDTSNWFEQFGIERPEIDKETGEYYV